MCMTIGSRREGRPKWVMQGTGDIGQHLDRSPVPLVLTTKSSSPETLARIFPAATDTRRILSVLASMRWLVLALITTIWNAMPMARCS